MVFKDDYCLMQVKRITEHSAILSTFIKLPVVIKTFVLSICSGCFTQVLLYEIKCLLFGMCLKDRKLNI